MWSQQTQAREIPDMVTREGANLIHSREVRAHGATEKGRVAALSLAAKETSASA